MKRFVVRFINSRTWRVEEYGNASILEAANVYRAIACVINPYDYRVELCDYETGEIIESYGF